VVISSSRTGILVSVEAASDSRIGVRSDFMVLARLVSAIAGAPAEVDG